MAHPDLEAVAIAPLESLQQMYAHFLECIVNNMPSPISAGAMATDLVRVMDAIARAAKTGQPVHL